MANHNERPAVVRVLQDVHGATLAGESQTDKSLAVELKQYAESKLPDRLLRQKEPGRGAKVVRDKFGVPHIFAENQGDLWFASGTSRAQQLLPHCWG